MLYFVIGAAVLVISIIFRLTAALGLTIPLLYGLLAPTLFSKWFYANQPLAEGIGYALLALVALSWLISLISKIVQLVQARRDDKIAEELFLFRLRKAKEKGEDTVSTEGLWR